MAIQCHWQLCVTAFIGLVVSPITWTRTCLLIFLIAAWLMDISSANDPTRNSMDWEIHRIVSTVPCGLQFLYQSWETWAWRCSRTAHRIVNKWKVNWTRFYFFLGSQLQHKPQPDFEYESGKSSAMNSQSNFRFCVRLLWARSHSKWMQSSLRLFYNYLGDNELRYFAVYFSLFRFHFSSATWVACAMKTQWEIDWSIWHRKWNDNQFLMPHAKEDSPIIIDSEEKSVEII